MSNCRKCGARKITRRSAGLFVCRRCGVQPGTFNFDRFGSASPRSVIEPVSTQSSDYQFSIRQPRLPASPNLGK
jgi:hypothetical protein